MSGVTAILSIQSSVAYGHVGNSAVVFPLMRMGVEVWPVNTVHFSNHTGYETWYGPTLTAQDISQLVQGLDERGVLHRCDAVLSGYQGGTDVAEAILAAVALVKARNPAAVYCCDPVMGDADQGIFVQQGITELIRERVVPAAQIITPNAYELEVLTGRGTSSREDVLAAADVARSMGPDIVLVTSVQHPQAAEGTIAMVLVTGEGAWAVSTPALPQTFDGAGDLTAALFLAQLLDFGHPPAALARTAAGVFGVLAATADAGERELQLVAAQEELVRPRRAFSPERLR
jgi:pyridoxine kinase